MTELLPIQHKYPINKSIWRRLLLYVIVFLPFYYLWVGVYDLWAGRVLYRAKPAVLWGLDFFSLIQRTPRTCFNMVRNKRSMGHIAHLRYQFKSINILYHNVDSEKNKPIIFILRIEWSLL